MGVLNGRAIPYRDVRITGGFWKRWQDAAAEATIPAIYNQFEMTGRIGALAHKWRAHEPNRPHIFYDSDAAKWIEGAAYSLFYRPCQETEARIEALIDCIESGMSAEGYFNSYFQAIEPHERWTRRTDHELYCAGHLIEAAVAYYEATGKRRFLDLMLRYAEYIRATFAENESASFKTPGHEEIEIALIRLWDCTGEKKWLELSLHFIRERGTDLAEQCFNHWFSPRYAQDQAPIAEQDSAEGHVVRFGYLYYAVARAAGETGDATLLAACKRVWDDVVNRKMYVTGGVGNMKHGEAFGPAYFLPNYEAYTETCASIALAFFGRALSAIERDGAYADICELQLYNGALAGISLDGRRFFYENPLSLRPSDQSFFNENKASSRPSRRVEVFSCSCCPPNILRMITAAGEWMYSVSSGQREAPVIYVHQYAQSETKLSLVSYGGDAGRGGAERGDEEITLIQQTNYPWDGKIELTVKTRSPFKAVLAFRAPEWCAAPKISVPATKKDGYIYVERQWADGDAVTLELPMDVRELEANPYVSQDAGRVALKRGPIVYCVEGVDNGECLEDLLIPADAAYEAIWDGGLLGGVCKLRFRALRRKPFEALYRDWSPEYEETTLTAVPYYAWGNRDECGEMAVWLRKGVNK